MRAPAAVLALASLAGAMFLAGHHPLWPLAALLLVAFSFVAAVVWRGGWLVLLPAGLPWLNFSPWTGWLVFEEFDLLVLGTFAGVYARAAWQASLPAPAAAAGPPWPQRLGTGLVWALAVSGAVSLLRGLVDAGGFRLGWFDGYTDPLNSLRVFKSLLFALLLLPPLRAEVRQSPERACGRLVLGMGLGLACVSLAVLWERVAFPGLLEFGQVYRTTALFWEMHVGGGAIDGYLAMAVPFAFLALASARRPLVQGLAALLVLLAAYACLSTFSRGLYLAVLLPAVLLAIALLVRRLRRRHARPPPERTGRWTRIVWLGVLVASVLLLVNAVLGPDTFMTNRLGNTEKVWGGRLAHWEEARGLLETRTDGWLGLGLGRFPAHYAARTQRGEFSGALAQRAADGDASAPGAGVVIQGPRSRARLGGLFALTQRVPIVPGASYEVRLDVRAPAPARLAVHVCERHLLYDWNCQGVLARVVPPPAPWQTFSARLMGPDFAAAPWFAPRLGMLSISVLDPGDAVEVGAVSLTVQGGGELLDNGDFRRGLAHWFPAAQYYFLPWHADSLYMELLLERGWLGLTVWCVLAALALGLLLGPGRGLRWSPYLAASLVGALLAGMANSLLDVPRVAFLLHLLVFFALQLVAVRDISPPLPKASTA